MMLTVHAGTLLCFIVSCQIQLRVDIKFKDFPFFGQNFFHKDSLFKFFDQNFVSKFKLCVHRVLPKGGRMQSSNLQFGWISD